MVYVRVRDDKKKIKNNSSEMLRRPTLGADNEPRRTYALAPAAARKKRAADRLVRKRFLFRIRAVK